MLPSHLPLFLKVVQAGSFSAAARDVGLSAAAVSKSIAQLEKQLQTRLFHRTTHSLALTDEGKNLYNRVEPLVKQLEDQIRISSESSSVIRGRIKVNLPQSFGLDLVYPHLMEFMRLYPEIELDLHFDDKVKDLVDNGFDIGIGNRINEDSRLIARPFYSLRIIAACSLGYAEEHAVPESYDDLKEHNCIAYRSPTSGRRIPWTFKIENNLVQYIPRGQLTVNSPEAAAKAAENSLGIVMVGHWHLKEGLKKKSLIQVLGSFEQEPTTVWLYYSSRSYLPARTRLLIDYLIQKIKG